MRELLIAAMVGLVCLPAGAQEGPAVQEPRKEEKSTRIIVPKTVRRAGLHAMRLARANMPEEVRAAVDRGLAWLAAHQDDDGRWDADDFWKHDPNNDRCDGGGGALFDVGVSGLALLAFLGAGHDDKTTAHAAVVARGLRFLIQAQDEDGCFGTRASQAFMYNHTIASLAVVEAYAMTKRAELKEPALRAIRFVEKARNPHLAWRYGIRAGDNDTSLSGWCVHLLHTARAAGFEVDPGAFVGAFAWIEKMTEGEFGRAGYIMSGGTVARLQGAIDRFPPEQSEAMTASALCTRVFCGEDPRTSVPAAKGRDLCLALPPKWNPDMGSIDLYYWYFGSMAMHQQGGDAWARWERSLRQELLANQHAAGAGARTGSWDPIGCWGGEGGRVYSTAIALLCLETYDRYPRLFAR